MKRTRFAIKGRQSCRRYCISLARVFFGVARRRPSSLDDSIARTVGVIPRFNPQPLRRIIGILERDSSCGFGRLPCAMGEDADKLRFNLCYQDSRVKAQLERLFEESRALPSPNRTASACFNLLASALTVRTPDGSCLWQKMNDNDLDALVFSVLQGCDAQSQFNVLREGFMANQLALDGLPPLDELEAWPLDKMIECEVFAGTVWWSERCRVWDVEKCARKRMFGIDDRRRFVQGLRTGPCRLVLFSDDNGELVWDLLLTRVLLEAFPQLHVTFVANAIPVGNNANGLTLRYCLNHPHLVGLRREGRFRIFLEENVRSSLEPVFFSRRLRAEVKSNDVALLKGVGLFETAQSLPLPAFYGFVVHSRDSEIITGLPKGRGVFVRIPPNSTAYEFRQRTLLDFCREHPRAGMSMTTIRAPK